MILYQQGGKPANQELEAYQDSLALYDFYKKQSEIEEDYPLPWNRTPLNYIRDYMIREKDPRHFELQLLADSITRDNPRMSILQGGPARGYEGQDWFDLPQELRDSLRVANPDKVPGQLLTPYFRDATSPDLVHESIEPTDWYWGRGVNDIWPKPTGVSLGQEVESLPEVRGDNIAPYITHDPKQEVVYKPEGLTQEEYHNNFQPVTYKPRETHALRQLPVRTMKSRGVDIEGTPSVELLSREVPQQVSREPIRYRRVTRPGATTGTRKTGYIATDPYGDEIFLTPEEYHDLNITHPNYGGGNMHKL